MAESVDEINFVEDNLVKYDYKEDNDMTEIEPNYEISGLCERETNLKYSERQPNLYWTKPSKRKIFLAKFRSVLKEYMTNAYENFNNMEIINQLSQEYEDFYNKVRPKDGEIIIIGGEDFKSDCLGHFFVRVMKMLGFVMKKKPRTESKDFRYKDVFVQLMFIKGCESYDRYFYLIYSKKPETENGYEMVVLDDFIFNSIIQNLILNIQDLPPVQYTTRSYEKNFPQTFKVVFTAYLLLWKFINLFSVSSQNLITM